MYPWKLFYPPNFKTWPRACVLLLRWTFSLAMNFAR